MQIIPAIDLMNGRVVRLTRGDPEKATFYDQWGSPVDVAQKWKSEGAQRLHVIDLDAAFGKPNNLKVVSEISGATNLPIQMGGGVRSVEAVRKILGAGIQHVILGSLAFRDTSVITKLSEEYGANRLIVALDNRQGSVMIEGWTSKTGLSLKEALEKYGNLGVTSFLITSITRDGTLSGPDLKMLKNVRKWSSGETIAAGGIGSLEDLSALKRSDFDAAVVGKALYERRFTLKDAISKVRES